MHIALLATEYPFSICRHTRESGTSEMEAKARGVLVVRSSRTMMAE
jgi:hypothetical protein